MRIAAGFIISLASLLGVALAETPGKDGPATVSSNTVVNEYASIVSSATAGATSITVDSIAGNLPSLSVGDLILIYQANGATIDGSDTANYGDVTNIGNAGHYEFQTVGSISGNTITLETYNNSCTGLEQSYGNGDAQVIRVPQYTTLTVTGGGTITSPLWDGSTGGVVAVHVEGALSLGGTVDVAGRGFRGGEVDNSSTESGSGNAVYRSTDPARGGEKGESIAGYQDDYPGGRYARGAPANGGGGGNGHNAGGGGGANGNNNVTWTGQGNPDLSTPSWSAAWNIDPSLNAGSTSSGGGRGGYSFSFQDRDALTVPPGDAEWQNDFRREVGGLGGRPMPFSAASRLFFGGGGGAGDGNNDAASAGGNGGGLVIIIAGSVSGSGTVDASGADAEDTSPGHNDAPGGGGGGGTVLIKSGSLSGITIRADGGNGGNQLITNTESEGPGGGGGGGIIALEGGVASTTTDGGANGITTSSSLTEFLPNGATMGATGQPAESAPADNAFPFCFRPEADLSLTQKITPVTVSDGDPIQISLLIRNNGPDPATNVTVTDLLPAEITYVSDSSGGTAGSPADYDPATGLWTVGSLAAGSSVTLTISATISGTSPVTNIAEISASDQFDPDSVPGTGSSNGIEVDDGLDGDSNPVDDDETSVTVTPDSSGIIISGQIFIDNGTGTGATAHNGLVEGSEAGSASVTIEAVNDSGVTIGKTETDGNGFYELLLPDTAAGSPVTLRAGLPDARFLHISGNPGGLADSDTTDGEVTFTPSAATAYPDIDFGIIETPQLQTDRIVSASPGQSVLLPHRFRATTSLQTDFALTDISTTPDSAFSLALFRDTDCNSLIDNGETVYSGPVTADAGDEICLIIRATVAAGAPATANARYRLEAAGTYDNTASGFALFNEDRISAGAAAGLELEKLVCNRSETSCDPVAGIGYGTANTGAPGDTLSYIIRFNNTVSAAASSIAIFDRTPDWTTLVPDSAAVVTTPASLSCTLTVPPSPDVTGYTGNIEWTCSGDLPPGETGTVVFDVTIQP